MDHYNEIANMVHEAYANDNIDDLLYIAHILNAHMVGSPSIQASAARQLRNRPHGE